MGKADGLEALRKLPLIALKIMLLYVNWDLANLGNDVTYIYTMTPENFIWRELFLIIMSISKTNLMKINDNNYDNRLIFNNFSRNKNVTLKSKV